MNTPSQKPGLGPAMQTKSLSRRVVVALSAIALSAIAFMASLPSVDAADCPTCNSVAEQIMQQRLNREKIDVILKKNNDFLAGLDPNDVSRRVKIKSNLIMIALRIETIENSISSLKEELQQKGCQACQSPTNSQLVPGTNGP